mmetsp:Transcript_17510/g.24799  ORF Transcript_17510/g.24799 Transcript_17510/m.24799 type:complete len:158 (+) Transcript_17510:51-524(+)
MKVSAFLSIASIAFITLSGVIAGTTQAGIDFLASNKLKEGVVELPSGLQYQIIKSGPDSGKSPSVSTPCLCHYSGVNIEGKEFDSSFKRGQPATFAPNQVILGWTEAMQMMREGDHWKLFIPSELAYGDRGYNDIITPGAVLIFELQLLQVLDKDEL